jgi:hypothetical protein
MRELYLQLSVPNLDFSEPEVLQMRSIPIIETIVPIYIDIDINIDI